MWSFRATRACRHDCARHCRAGGGVPAQKMSTMSEVELRERVAEAIWNVDNSNPRWRELDTKVDRELKREIYKMADAALAVIKTSQ